MPAKMQELLAYVGAGALALLVLAMIVTYQHNTDLKFGTDRDAQACAARVDAQRPYLLETVRAALGCYENTAGQSSAKDRLKTYLGGACRHYAAINRGDTVDLDERGKHAATLPDVKDAYAEARQIKDAGVACPDIPRDPDDYGREIAIAVVLLLGGGGALAYRRLRATNDTRTLTRY
jgi:hypothetical protein